MLADRTAGDASRAAAELIEVVQQLSLARDPATVRDVVRRAARRLTGADGATFVLRDGGFCHYVDEDAIAPLWKGRRFPLETCISGWAMLNRRPAVIEDIYADPRIPHDAYRPTFVKSLVMVPVRRADPLGAIGAYWAAPRAATPAEVGLLQALADTTAVALENVRVYAELEERVRARTAELEAANRELVGAYRQADRVFSAFAKALPGTVLDGKYRLEEQLGAGGYGAVFRGRHLALDAPVAVKVFRPAPGNDSAQELRRFLREGAAAARLDHPNAVRVIDTGVSEEGVAFLVMELLRGRSLGQELAALGPLPLPRAAGIAARVADVLAAAHRAGILHRDIKPDNVFLHAAGGVEVVKVVDFGIAKFFGPGHGAAPAGITRPGTYIMGTPSFVAPERITGEPDDGRSDVFSLGTTLYHAVCNASPWTRAQLAALAAGTAGDLRPVPMARFRHGVPAALEDLTGRALATNPAARPTAAEFAAALSELAGVIGDAPRTPAAAVSPLPETACMPPAGADDTADGADRG